jgi:putative cell wall-binding protein
MRRTTVRRGLALAVLMAVLGVGHGLAGTPSLPSSRAQQTPQATATVVPWTGRGQAPCPEGETRVRQALAQGFSTIPQARFNRGFYLVDSTLGSKAARSHLPDGSRTRDHLFLSYTSVTPGQRTMLGFATRGTTPGGYYATVDVNSRSIQVGVGGTAWSGRVYDVTAATDDEGGALGTWFEHRARGSGRTWWDLDNVQIYTCRTAPVTRIAGADRYATSARVASRYAAGPAVAFLVQGNDFADGVSVGALAASLDAPVLLVTRDTIPTAVRGELSRLRPERIVVVGGTSAISDTVVAEAAAYTTTGEVRRIGGETRYETSALVAAEFPAGPPVVYVTTGASFPDALTGSALAGDRDAPLVLTAPTTLPAPVRDALMALEPQSVVVVGGPGSVSEAVAAQLGTLLQVPVRRIAGQDRYGTAAAVAAEFAPGRPRVYVATGLAFPDALSGAALAGSEGVPVVLSRAHDVPAVTLTALDRLDAAAGVLLGGRVALEPLVMDRVGGRVG